MSALSAWFWPGVFGLLGAIGGGLLGPALGAVGERNTSLTMSDVDYFAKQEAGPRRVRPQSGSGNTSDDSGNLILFGAALVFLTFEYVRYRALVLVGLATLSTVVFLIAAVVIWLAWRHKVIAGSTGTFLSLLFPGCLTAVGIIDVVLLWNGAGANEAQRSILETCVFPGTGIDLSSLPFFVYEMLGAAMFCVTALGAIWLCLARITAIYVVEEARPAALWRFSYRNLQLSMGWAHAALIIGAGISVVASSGALDHWISSLSTTIPTQSPTPHR